MVRAALPVFCLALSCTVLDQARADVSTCKNHYWPGVTPDQEVDSVSIAELQGFLDTQPIFDGITFAVSLKGQELWLDVVRYPKDVTALASIRSIMIIGRVVRPEYSKLVLADVGKGVFEISYDAVHLIGCQFVWGERGKGQNPIALNRDLVDNLRFYASEQRIAPPFNGSLMGDTSKMLGALTEIVYPSWLLKNTVIE